MICRRNDDILPSIYSLFEGDCGPDRIAGRRTCAGTIVRMGRCDERLLEQQRQLEPERAIDGAASVVLNFGGSTTYTATDDISGAFTLNQLSFNGSTAATTITIDLSSSAGATGITLGGASPGIILASTNQAAVTFTAATPLTLAAAATISNNSSNGALLTIMSAVNNSGFTLLVNGTANTAINGAISGAGGLTMSSAGQLQLKGNNTYGGPTRVNSGTILFNASAWLCQNTTVTVNSGATAGFAFVPSPSQLQQFTGRLVRRHCLKR